MDHTQLFNQRRLLKFIYFADAKVCGKAKEQIISIYIQQFKQQSAFERGRNKQNNNVNQLWTSFGTSWVMKVVVKFFIEIVSGFREEQVPILAGSKIPP